MANASSGIVVDNDCKLKFLELESKRAHRFITFKIDDKLNMITVDKLSNPSQTYDDFTAALPETVCKYAVHDFDFVTEENCQKSKIIFIAWSPDTSKVCNKMLYANSKDRFRRELDGVQCGVQATDSSKIGIENIRDITR
ncbi:hypothetical protein SUGI_1096890 [Cryptomeria japonica]|uniref:actin-depolymerizing factor 7-like n=1 Tax=Cryptomeria japonica TaxID=3369 RepID=UPI002414AB52|nr:actin-depolymerizing factor 7-like [Cryptomeria japonica]GLJ51609.1 hypothetical protein SUGI_1096890 [Cryptomeria japonica]